jgi:hypothetical protein
MHRLIVYIGFIACMLAVIPASFTSTSSKAMDMDIGHFRFPIPHVTLMAEPMAVQHLLLTSMPHLSLSSNSWVTRHSVVDVATDGAGSDASSSAPSPSAGLLNTSRATGGKSLMSPFDDGAVGSILMKPPAFNVQFVAMINRISAFLVPSRSHVLALAPDFDSEGSHASFAIPPLPLQGFDCAFECAITKNRGSMQRFSGRYDLQLSRAPIGIGASPFPSMHPTTAQCDTPAIMPVGFENGFLVSTSPHTMFAMAGSVGAFLSLFCTVAIPHLPAATSSAAFKYTPRSLSTIGFRLSTVVATCLAILSISILLRLHFLHRIVFRSSFCYRIKSHRTGEMRVVWVYTAFAACASMLPTGVETQVGQRCRNVAK